MRERWQGELPRWVCLFSVLVASVGQMAAASAAPINNPEIDAFLKKQKKAAEGKLGKCESATGVYRPENSSAHLAPLNFTFLEEPTLKLVQGLSDYRVLMRAETLAPNGAGWFLGVLFENESGWWLLQVKKQPRMWRSPLTAENPWQKEEAEAVLALNEYRAHGKAGPDYGIQKLSFKDDMTSLRFDSGSSYRYDGIGTVKRYVMIKSDLDSRDLLYTHQIRVPVEMYPLVSSPELTQARDSRNYTRALDLIYSRASQIMGGDTQSALFTALLTTDMRERGACGSVYGLRGRIFSPVSIFDQEVPQRTLIGSRLDAVPHFFAYAILDHIFGKPLTEAQSTKSKTPSFQKAFGRWTRKFHYNNDVDLGRDNENMGLVTRLYDSIDLSDRPASDRQFDLMYNDMGIEFGERLRANPRTLPSQVINSKAFDTRKAEVGIPVKANAPWSYDPPELTYTARHEQALQIWEAGELTRVDLEEGTFNFLKSSPVYLVPINSAGSLVECQITLPPNLGDRAIRLDKIVDCHSGQPVSRFILTTVDMKGGTAPKTRRAVLVKTQDEPKESLWPKFPRVTSRFNYSVYDGQASFLANPDFEFKGGKIVPNTSKPVMSVSRCLTDRDHGAEAQAYWAHHDDCDTGNGPLEGTGFNSVGYLNSVQKNSSGELVRLVEGFVSPESDQNRLDAWSFDVGNSVSAFTSCQSEAPVTNFPWKEWYFRCVTVNPAFCTKLDRMPARDEWEWVDQINQVLQTGEYKTAHQENVEYLQEVQKKKFNTKQRFDVQHITSLPGEAPFYSFLIRNEEWIENVRNMAHLCRLFERASKFVLVSKESKS